MLLKSNDYIYKLLFIDNKKLLFCFYNITIFSIFFLKKEQYGRVN